MMIDKQSVLSAYYDLYCRGEMLKAQKYINECVPLPLDKDPDIVSIRRECNNRISEIKSWSGNGRPYPGTHCPASDPIGTFPKFERAIEIIGDMGENLNILDVGCYTGDFLKILAGMGHKCVGVDIHAELMRMMNMGSGNPKFLFGRAESLSDFVDLNKFDVVILFDVLEHCFFPEVVISEVDKVAVPGAKIMINLPQTYMNYEDGAGEHLHMFSIDMIQNMFEGREKLSIKELEDERGDPTFFITYNR